MNGTTFDTFDAARSLEGAGVEREQAEAIASAIGAQNITRADLDAAVEPLATKAKLRVLQWTVGIQSAIMLATFAIVAAKLL